MTVEDNNDGAIRSVAVIGAGNVATHLAHALSKHCDVAQIYSRSMANAEALASKIGGAEPIDSLADLRSGLDLYLIAVADDAISAVVEATKDVDTGIWAHTSGSGPMDVFRGRKTNFGVFYPLQTLSKTKPVDIGKVPFLIEGDSESTSGRLFELASRLSSDVKTADSDMRRKLHVAAVFACNFANFMWIQADDILHQSGLDISILRPLLSETLVKISEVAPIDGQTGPARRGDMATIERHLAMLRPDQAEIYDFLSRRIIETYHHK